jgi:RND family efflux transporter MFP subunit
MKHIWIVASAALVAACGGDEPRQETGPAEPVAVTVTEAWTAPAAARYAARVEAGQSADVATRASGTLTGVAVDVGDRVRAGQVVAHLDASDVQARIEGARAAAELAERTLGRVQRLAADGAASQQELDEMSARASSARAAVQEAEAQAAYVEVRAPFDGVVTARMADPGDLAVPGRPVLRIAGTGALKVAADLPSDLSGSVRPGQAVAVRTAAGDRVPATVTRVVPTLDPTTRRFRVEASPSGSGLRAGQVVSLELDDVGSGSQWIPADAVVRRGQLQGVYVVEADTLRLRWLRLGRSLEEVVEVLAGPPGTLTVVRRPADTLRDGQPVSRTTSEAPPTAAGPAASETEAAR